MGSEQKMQKMEAPILSVESLWKSFGGLVAVDDISFEVQSGEVVGLMGPNGAGKTTLLNLLSGGDKLDAGSVRFKGKEIGGLSPHKICRLGISRTYQIPQPFTALTVRDNVKVPALYGQKPRPHAEVESDIDKLLEMVGLATKQNLLCNQLMVVALKKVELARALASNPSLILLDEVAAGSTDKELPQIAEVIKIIREMGKTVIMVEHIIKLMVNVVDRIIVMDKGRKIAEGSPEEVMKDADVIKAYLG
jgi:branched-chain amino acid transport system ATP-binding protein